MSSIPKPQSVSASGKASPSRASNRGGKRGGLPKKSVADQQNPAVVPFDGRESLLDRFRDDGIDLDLRAVHFAHGRIESIFLAVPSDFDDDKEQWRRYFSTVWR